MSALIANSLVTVASNLFSTGAQKVRAAIGTSPAWQRKGRGVVVIAYVCGAGEVAEVRRRRHWQSCFPFFIKRSDFVAKVGVGVTATEQALRLPWSAAMKDLASEFLIF
eukprot:gene35509-47742_t